MSAALVAAWLAAAARPVTAATRVATLDVVRGGVEASSGGQGWRRAAHGAPVFTGQRLRTDAEAVALVRFPWMSLLLDGSTTIALAPSRVLSATLEQGRLEQRSERGILKLRTAEAQLTGQGHLVLRRQQGQTLVSVLSGRFEAVALGGGGGVTLRQGQGASVRAGGGRPQVVTLPAAPTALRPGADPSYVKAGGTVSLAWSVGPARHHLQLLDVASDEVLLSQEVDGAMARLEAPPAGTYRWRVAAHDSLGLEGPPSTEGYFCVVE